MREVMIIFHSIAVATQFLGLPCTWIVTAFGAFTEGHSILSSPIRIRSQEFVVIWHTPFGGSDAVFG